jgi:hypothetical protein
VVDRLLKERNPYYGSLVPPFLPLESVINGELHLPSELFVPPPFVNDLRVIVSPGGFGFVKMTLVSVTA